MSIIFYSSSYHCENLWLSFSTGCCSFHSLIMNEERSKFITKTSENKSNWHVRYISSLLKPYDSFGRKSVSHYSLINFSSNHCSQIIESVSWTHSIFVLYSQYCQYLKITIQSQKPFSPTDENSASIYSPSCCTKSVWLFFKEFFSHSMKISGV